MQSSRAEAGLGVSLSSEMAKTCMMKIDVCWAQSQSVRRGQSPVRLRSSERRTSKLEAIEAIPLSTCSYDSRISPILVR